MKFLLIAILVIFNTAAMANNWGFYGYGNAPTVNMPVQQSNGSYAFNQTKDNGNKNNIFSKIKDKFNTVKNRLIANNQDRKDKRWSRKEAYYACLQSGVDAKTCRGEKRDQAKEDRAELRAKRKEARVARRDDRKAKRINRKLARLEKRKGKLLARLNNN